jgi:hypothetical protein
LGSHLSFKRIARVAVHDRAVGLLDSLPGAALFGALLIKAENGPWERFATGASLAR